jgi:predicted ArsR family transcriptional regulator
VSNSRPFRRRLAVTRKAITKRRKDRIAGRWPFGGPSLSTVRKWMRDLHKAGLVERTVQHTGKPGRPPYAYRWIGPQEPSDDRSVEDQVLDERVVTILRRARGKPLTEDQIIARYKEAMARRDAAAHELATP